MPTQVRLISLLFAYQTDGLSAAIYPEGLVEFYFETARTFMDLTITQTIANFTSLKWVVPHAGGSFPSIEDRFITSQPPAVLAASKAAYSTR